MGKSRKALAPQVVPIVPAVVPRYLAVPEAARYLATTIWNVRQLISDRKIPFVKLGKKFVIDIQDLDRFFESRKVKAA